MPFVWKSAMIALAAPVRAVTRETRLRQEAASDRSELFVGLVGRELDRSYRLAGLLLGDAAEAEDAVGDALERAWSGIDRLRDPDGFQAWFDRILVNVCRDRLRRRSRVRFIPLDPTHDRPAAGDPFRTVLEQDAVLVRLGGLPADERVVIVLHYWADLTHEAIAGRLGWPVGTVKSRLHRALERMRDDEARWAGETEVER